MLVSTARTQRMRGSVKAPERADAAGAKKERTPGKHSRNGCGTCKKRRVKCDEEKPTCLRCRNFGVGCDGYEAPSRPKCSNSTTAGSALLQPRKILRKAPSPYVAIATSPSTMIHESDIEQRYFLSFRDTAACGAQAYIDSQTWRRMLLQASTEPAIRHAVIALGALEEWSSICNTQGSLALNKHHLGTSKLHQTAIQHYNKSISIMRKISAAPKKDMRTFCLLSLVIICFESLHRNYALASPQVYTSLALIQNGSSPEPESPTSNSSSSSDAVEHDLVRIFGRLEIQTMCFVDPRPTDTHQSLVKEGADRMRDMPSAFSNADEAKDYMEILVRRAQHLIHLADALFGHGHSDGSVSPPDISGVQSTTPPGDSCWAFPNAEVINVNTSFYSQQLTPPKTPSYPTFTEGSSSPSPPPPSYDLSQNQSIHLHDISRWKSSFDGFLHRNPSELANPSTTLLRIYYLVVYVATHLANPTTAEPIHPVPPPNFTNEMATIVNLSAQLLPTLRTSHSSPPLQPQATTALPTLPTSFNFDLGVILPLYFVGIQCRDNAVRKSAIDLLLLPPPHTEGINNTVVAGKIAEWVMGIENEWLNERGEIPQWARAQSLKVNFDQDRKCARVKCVQGSVGDGSLGSRIVRRETVVYW